MVLLQASGASKQPILAITSDRTPLTRAVILQLTAAHTPGLIAAALGV